MPISNEPMIQEALAGYNSGQFESYRAAARAYNLQASTLIRRDKGTHLNASEGHQNQAKLPKQLENLLVDWILFCETCGHPVTHAQIHEFVLLLLKSMGEPQELGKGWVTRFIQRNDKLATKIGQKIDAQRVDNANEDTLITWFSKLDALIVKLHLNPQNLYNCDETGIALGVCTNTTVVGSSKTHKTRIK